MATNDASGQELVRHDASWSEMTRCRTREMSGKNLVRSGEKWSHVLRRGKDRGGKQSEAVVR